MNITIVLADDHALVRGGLRLLLNAQPDMRVTGEAANGLEASQLIAKVRPDVALVDISMPLLNGLAAIAQIREATPATRILVLSMHTSSEYVYRALKAGAHGYVVKEAAPEELLTAIRTVHAGQRYLSPKLSDELITEYIDQPTTQHHNNPLAQLSERERHVLQLVVEGKVSTEIGALLGLSPKTVDTYRSRLMQKLDIHDLPALVKFAIQQGITTID